MSNTNLNNNGTEKCEPHIVTVIVNGRCYNVQHKDMSFDDVVKLAFGNVESSERTAYTITYSYKHGHTHENGIMVQGDVIKNVKEGMVFNVTKTSRS